MCDMWFSKFIISICILLVSGQTSFGQECDSSGVKCISCTDYQTCAGPAQGRTVSCKGENDCADSQLKLCQMKLNCYALNECTQNGIFPDAMVDSNYFVCLSDGAAGFIKYDFTCPEEHFFDQSAVTCVSRSVTSPNAIDTTTSTETTPTSTETTPTSSETTPTATETTPTSTETTPTATETTPTATETTPTATETTPTATETTPTATETTPTSTETTPTSTETTPPTTSTTPTSVPTEPPTTQSPPFVCAGPGIYPNPNNCKMYYRCSTALKAFFYICPGNSYFNENILKCSLIITPTCQQQILQNATSTLPPVTPPATITTTTPIRTTTTTTTTTTPLPTTSTTPPTPTTPVPTTSPTITTPALTTTTTTTITSPPATSTPPQFTCPSSGAFENPSDCKTYYRCSASGKIFRYICPGNTYFNEITKRCTLVITPRCRNLIHG